MSSPGKEGCVCVCVCVCVRARAGDEGAGRMKAQHRAPRVKPPGRGPRAMSRRAQGTPVPSEAAPGSRAGRALQRQGGQVRGRGQDLGGGRGLGRGRLGGADRQVDTETLRTGGARGEVATSPHRTRCLSSDPAENVMTSSEHTDGKEGKEPWRRGPEIWILPLEQSKAFLLGNCAPHFSALEHP